MPDVTVLGAGIFGLSIAWVCTLRGAKVQIIDPYGPGAGSSGGIVGALAPHTPENWNDKKAFQLDSLLMAASFWADVEAASGRSTGYARTGRVQPIMDSRSLELARQRETSARDLWKDNAKWEVVPAGTFDAWEPVSPSGFLIHDTLSGRMHPRQACDALVAALSAKGVEVQSSGSLTGKVVEATGWRGLLDLSETMGRMIGNGVKGQAALLKMSMPDAPQLFADTVHIVAHADGTVAIGSTSEREFESPDSVDSQLDEVLAKAIRAVPCLEGAKVINRWAGVRPRARSRAPMLGAHPLKPGHFIANGGFKIGFGMAPKIAHVMADLVLEGQDRIPDDFTVDASLRPKRR